MVFSPLFCKNHAKMCGWCINSQFLHCGLSKISLAYGPTGMLPVGSLEAKSSASIIVRDC